MLSAIGVSTDMYRMRYIRGIFNTRFVNGLYRNAVYSDLQHIGKRRIHAADLQVITKVRVYSWLYRKLLAERADLRPVNSAKPGPVSASSRQRLPITSAAAGSHA